jgi:hypothetical protein
MTSRAAAVTDLGRVFLACGYARFPTPDRLQFEGWATYYQGGEVRFALPGHDTEALRRSVQ